GGAVCRVTRAAPPHHAPISRVPPRRPPRRPPPRGLALARGARARRCARGPRPPPAALLPPGSTALQQRLAASNPARHAEGAELPERGVEERPCALGIAGSASARVHERLVVVDDRAQRARALLVEDAPRLSEPIGRLVVSTLECAESA